MLKITQISSINQEYGKTLIADGSGNLYANGIVQIGSGALPAGANGQIAYDGTHFYGYTGGAWKQLDN